METAWMEHGNCRNLPPERFFPSDDEDVAEVTRICSGCVVKSPCLDYALDNQLVYGIWGGATEAQRRRLARANRRRDVLRLRFRAS